MLASPLDDPECQQISEEHEEEEEEEEDVPVRGHYDGTVRALRWYCQGPASQHLGVLLRWAFSSFQTVSEPIITANPALSITVTELPCGFQDLMTLGLDSGHSGSPPGDLLAMTPPVIHILTSSLYSRTSAGVSEWMVLYGRMRERWMTYSGQYPASPACLSRRASSTCIQ